MMLGNTWLVAAGWWPMIDHIFQRWLTISPVTHVPLPCNFDTFLSRAGICPLQLNLDGLAITRLQKKWSWMTLNARFKKVKQLSPWLLEQLCLKPWATKEEFQVLWDASWRGSRRVQLTFQPITSINHHGSWPFWTSRPAQPLRWLHFQPTRVR